MLIALLMPFASNATPLSYALQVDGLACPFCAYGIEKKLSVIDGVTDIKVDIAKGEVVVTMTEDKTLSESRAQEQVKKAGFKLRSLSPINEEQ